MDDASPLPHTLRAARMARGWTLEQFADASRVSRAMISKIERGEVSPTAAILARLAAGLGVTLASLFAAPGGAGEPVARAVARAKWTDPATGYVRRNVSPPAAAGTAEIVEVTFPPGERVVFDNALGWHGISQQVWVFEGEMDITVGPDVTRLHPGDCLFMRLDQPIVFANPGEGPARYAVILTRKSL